MENNNKFDVFISYRRENSYDIARLICSELKYKYNYNVSFDEDNLGGGRFDLELLNRIEECRIFLLIVTATTFERCKNEEDWVRQEIACALKNEKHIIPIFVDVENFPEEKLPEEIEEVKSWNGLKYDRNNFNGFINKLKIFIESKINIIDGIEYSPDGKILIKAPKDIKGRVFNIPDGVTKIGDGAFKGCTSLEEISFPESVTYIGNSAFEACISLARIYIPKKVSYIGDYAFKGCMSLYDITTEENFLYIRYAHPYIPYKLTLFPDSELKIGKEAFYGCSCLKNASIRSVVQIGEYAFCACTALERIEIHGNLKEIERDTFSGCKDLKYIAFETTNLTIIGGRAFVGCTSLKKFNIPDSVTKIGNWAFHGCTELTEISIPDSVEEIGGYAFDGCIGLTEITIPDSMTEIGDESFAGCTGLTKFNIPDSVKKIGERAFEGCTGLTEINIPDSVTVIGEWAFYGCTGLTKITIPDSVAEIYWHAFAGCKGLTDITIPNSVTEIRDWVFCGAGLTKATIPDSVTKIGDYVFADCTGLKEITIPDSVKEIGCNAFDGCAGLTQFSIPDSVMEICHCAFNRCPSLQSITFNGAFPPTVPGAFPPSIPFDSLFCPSTTNIFIPKGTKENYLKWIGEENEHRLKEY